MKYKCLVLDHDDTLVKSTDQIHYPAFCHTLEILRPIEQITMEDFKEACAFPGFLPLCVDTYGFSKEELDFELADWLEFVKNKIPDAHEGFGELLTAYRKAGGLICVVSHSDKSLIERDYMHHFGFLPHFIYDLNYPHQKPSPAPLQDFMNQTGLTPNDLLVVDDLPVGKEMAMAAGVDFVFAGWSNTAPCVYRQMEEEAVPTANTPTELFEKFINQ